jgi:hypothetical protein
MVSVLAHVPKLPLSLHPLIAEAKRRMRRRRLLVAALVVALAGGGAGAFFALRSSGPPHAGRSAALGRRPAPPPPPSAPSRTFVDVWGQPSRAAEVAGRPLDGALAVFRSSRLAAALPAPSGPMQPLVSVAAHMRGEPGALLPRETRRVVTAAGPIYLVPTTRGWACMQASRFETCHRGLLPQGISWDFGSGSGGLDVAGIAADDVAGVVLEYGKTRARASLRDNVFFVHRPILLTPGQSRSAFGVLTVSYRDGKPPRSVPLR